MPRATSRTYKARGGEVTAKVRQHSSPRIFAAKVALRVAALPPGDGPVRVLDCFAGDHDLWDAVAEVLPEGDIAVVHCDKNATRRTDLKVTAIEALISFDLDRFDLVDLDAWGQPFNEIDALANRSFKGTVA